MNKQRQKRVMTPIKLVGLIFLVAVIVILVSYLLLRGTNVAVLNPQGIIADKQKTLLVGTTLLGLAVIIPVFVLLFGFAWKYRASNLKADYRPKTDGNLLLEAAWWGIPIVIIGILSVITWTSTHDLDPYRALESDKKPINVQVVALQWKWLFIYPDLGIATVNEVRFPEKTPVNFTITADAPMSAFWIPNLGSQVYAMKGMETQLKLQADGIGEYRGSNTNINGKGYASMTFTAKSVDENEFATWANNIASSDSHLDISEYTSLVEPSEKNQVTYYMLHDKSLFAAVVSKSGHGANDGSHDPGETHEGTH